MDYATEYLQDQTGYCSIKWITSCFVLLLSTQMPFVWLTFIATSAGFGSSGRHISDVPLREFLRVDKEGLKPECGWNCPISCGLGLNKKRTKGSTSIHLSLLSGCGHNVNSYTMPWSYSLLATMDCISSKQESNKPFSTQLAFAGNLPCQGEKSHMSYGSCLTNMS